MTTKRLILLFVLSLALTLIPLSYTPLHAQGTQSDTQQNQQYNQNQTTDPNRNQNMNQNRDLNRDQNLNQNDQTTDRNRSVTSESTTQRTERESRTTTSGDVDTDDNALPSTAGELPLLALIGVLSLITAAGLRLAPVRRR
jgi:hypothetical protein